MAAVSDPRKGSAAARTTQRRIQQTARKSAAAMLVLALAGCSANPTEQQPTTPPPNSVLTSPAAPLEPYYQAIDETLCDDVRIYDVLTEYSITNDDRSQDYASSDSNVPGRWFVGCRYWPVTVSGYVGPLHPGPTLSPSLRVEVRDSPADAHDAYREWQPSGPADSGIERRSAAIAGWWDEASYVEEIRDYADPLRRGLVQFRLRHENLYVELDLGADFPAENVDEVIELLEEIARALFEELRNRLPTSGP